MMKWSATQHTAVPANLALDQAALMQAGAVAGDVAAARCGGCVDRWEGTVSGGCRGPVRLMSTSVCPITEKQCVTTVLESLRRGQGGWIVTLNLDHVRRCCRDPRYSKAVCDASLRVADGMPLVWASGLKRNPLPERVAGSDLVWSLSGALAEEGRSVYLLGGEPGTADAAAEVLGRNCRGFVIAGTHCPPIGFERDRLQMDALTNKLVAARPDLVFVALGSPKQEYLIQQIRTLLPGTWWIGVGISFSFVCGHVRRAPRWMQRSGLEWVHRLAQEPGRLASRYLLHGVPFGLQLMLHSLTRRV